MYELESGTKGQYSDPQIVRFFSGATVPEELGLPEGVGDFYETWQECQTVWFCHCL